jgi:hypothetical protein
MKAYFLEKRGITVCEVGIVLGISFGSVKSILKDSLKDASNCHQTCAPSDEREADSKSHHHVSGPSRDI